MIVPIASKNDAILSKLVWVKEGSEKSKRDIVGMLLDSEPVDHALIELLAKDLGVEHIWHQIREQATK